MRQIRLSGILPSVSILILMLLGYTAAAHAQSVVTEPVGFTTLMATQVLRIGATAAGSGPVTVRFRRIGYDQAPCQDGVCKYAVSSQITSAPIVLAAVWVSLSFVSAMNGGTAIFGGRLGSPLPLTMATSLCCFGGGVG